jgi:hypothetical protein
MITKRFSQLLKALDDNKRGLTTSEIMRVVDDLKDNEIIDITECSRMVYNCRGSGFLTSFQDGGKNRHKITEKGIEELNAFYYKTKECEPLLDIATDAEIEAVQVLDEAESLKSDDNTLEVSTIESVNTNKAEPSPDVFFYENEVAAGFLTLDPNNEIEASFITIIEAIKSANLKPEPVVIEFKQEKIKALRLIAKSPLIQKDIANFLGEIAVDLERCQDAA